MYKKTSLLSGSVMTDPFVTLWTVAFQIPLFLGFPRLEYWGGLPFPPPGYFPDSGTNSCLLHGQVYYLPLNHWESSQEAIATHNMALTLSEQVREGVWEEMRLVVNLTKLRIGQKFQRNDIQCWVLAGKKAWIYLKDGIFRWWNILWMDWGIGIY